MNNMYGNPSRNKLYRPLKTSQIYNSAGTIPHSDKSGLKSSLNIPTEEYLSKKEDIPKDAVTNKMTDLSPYAKYTPKILFQTKRNSTKDGELLKSSAKQSSLFGTLNTNHVISS